MSTFVKYRQDSYLWMLQQMDALRRHPSPHLDNTNLINMMMKHIVDDKIMIRQLWRRLLVIWISEHDITQRDAEQQKRRRYIQSRLRAILNTSPSLHHYYRQILNSLYQDALETVARTRPDIRARMPDDISVPVETLLTYCYS